MWDGTSCPTSVLRNIDDNACNRKFGFRNTLFSIRNTSMTIADQLDALAKYIKKEDFPTYLYYKGEELHIIKNLKRMGYKDNGELWEISK